MGGIATYTAHLNAAGAGTKAKRSDTRKPPQFPHAGNGRCRGGSVEPPLQELETDMIILKDNRTSPGGVAETIARPIQFWPAHRPTLYRNRNRSLGEVQRNYALDAGASTASCSQHGRWAAGDLA
jgi:nicotinate-nucleotide pyrophosphorylase (carboxylating)